MSRLTDLLSQVAKSDQALADDLRREVEVLGHRRECGLNFERQVPESVRLPNRRRRRGDRVVYLGCQVPCKTMSRLDRVTSDAEVCHGQPVIRGLRYPVQMLLALLASGMTIEEVLGDYPDLERDDLLAALEFGAATAGGQRMSPLSAA